MDVMGFPSLEMGMIFLTQMQISQTSLSFFSVASICFQDTIAGPQIRFSTSWSWPTPWCFSPKESLKQWQLLDGNISWMMLDVNLSSTCTEWEEEFPSAVPASSVASRPLSFGPISPGGWSSGLDPQNALVSAVPFPGY